MYVLDDQHRPVPCDDIQEWARRMQNRDHVGSDYVGDVWISTVFLGYDASAGTLRRPLLFETMVFGGALNQEMERYFSWEEALEGHARMVSRVAQGNGN